MVKEDRLFLKAWLIGIVMAWQIGNWSIRDFQHLLKRAWEGWTS